jgi:patatin-related protein
MSEPPVPDPKREVRLGLVLYGGVSLAVYMFGVVLEFSRLVRASRGAESNAYAPVLLYGQVTATVDVISGTSAGGINGILLAKALAAGSDLAALKTFWIERADLSLLLRRPNDLAPRSLLRSDFFEEQLFGVLQAIDRDTGPALVDVLDLFVSGTRLRGAPREFTDNLGQSIETRVYSKLFHLKFRQKGYNPSDPALGYDQNDFGQAGNRMLLEISRATSAFPGAFEPMLIERRSDNAALFTDDEATAAYFSDGGILHNKPFTETIATIFGRMADRPVRRWLLSLEPAPESYAIELAPGPEPEVLDVVQKALSGIPMYQSIITDLETLADRNARVRSMNVLLRRIEVVTSRQFSNVISSGGRDDFRKFLEQQVLYFPYESLKVDAVVNDLSTEIMKAASLPMDQRLFVEDGVRGAVDPVAPFLDVFDDVFRLRRLYYLIGILDGFTGTLAPGERERFRPAHQALWAQLDQIRTFKWEIFDTTSEIAPRLRGLHGQGGDALSAAVRGVMEALAALLPEKLVAIRAATLKTCEAIEADISAIKAQRPAGVDFPPHPFPAIFDRYEIRDMFILPLDILANLGERDDIGFIRISPEAATYIEKPSDKKLTGVRLGHFGGFLSREWRANDILWGRMDAAETIVKILLEGEDREAVRQQIHRVQEEIAREELPQLNRAASPDYKSYLEREYRIGE